MGAASPIPSASGNAINAFMVSSSALDSLRLSAAAPFSWGAGEPCDSFLTKPWSKRKLHFSLSPRSGARPGRSSRRAPTALTRPSEPAAADVNAAPLGAIVRIAAQPVGFVNVVGVAIRISRIPEDSRQLVRRQLARRLCGEVRNVLPLGLTCCDASRQPDRQRQPKNGRLSHWRASCALRAQARIAFRSDQFEYLDVYRH